MKPAWRLSAILLGATVTVPALLAPQAVYANAAVSQTAVAVTVFIQGINNPDNFGSGVIIKKSGQSYTILTAAHVVSGSDQFTVKTNDGLQYSVQQIKKLPNMDLALVQFESSSTYSIAKLGNSSRLQPTNSVFVAGYPKPGYNIPVPIFTITDGRIASIIPPQGVRDGYGVAYSNPTRAGMSGGPVFNDTGEVIAIHGRKEGELDGTAPSGAWVNLGIPINFYKDNGSTAIASNNQRQAELAKQQEQQRQAELAKQQEQQRQAELAKQQEQQRQAELAKQQEQQRQAELAKQQEQQRQAELAKQQEQQRQAELAKQQEQQRAQQASASSQEQLVALASVQPYQVTIPQSTPTQSRREVCKEVRINMIVTQRCKYETVEEPSIAANPFQESTGSAEVLIDAGNKSFATGDFGGALSSYSAAMNVNSSSGIAYFNRGVAQLKLQNQQKAIADFTKAAELFRARGDAAKYSQTETILKTLRQVSLTGQGYTAVI